MDSVKPIRDIVYYSYKSVLSFFQKKAIDILKIRKGKIVKEHFLTASNIKSFTKHFTINHKQC